MKNAILLIGAGENQKSFWFPWLKMELEKKEYKVWLPQLPDNDSPDLKKTLPFILENGKFDGETIMVGHSAGCPLILSVLEKIRIKIKKAVLVAGLIETTQAKEDLINWQKKFLQEKYDWEKIKNNCEEFIFINSVNDPWKCDDKQGRKMFEKLGGTLILNNEGYMGSETFNQPYKEFPLLLKVIE